MKLEDAQLPFMTSVGQITVAALAAQMLKAAKVDYRFDAERSDMRVMYPAAGLAWHGSLLQNLRALADLTALKLVIEGNVIRFVGGSE